MKTNEEKLITKVLTMIVGRDKHASHGHIEFDSPELQDGIESLTYALIIEDDIELEKALKTITHAVKTSIETWRDEFPEDSTTWPELHSEDEV